MQQKEIVETKVQIFNHSNLFKEVRYQKDLTQWEFAEELGCAQGYISKLENDLCTPSIYFLIRAKKRFELKWDYIENFYSKHPRYLKNDLSETQKCSGDS